MRAKAAKTLPLGSVGYESEPNERGERLIWLEDAMADRFGAMRGRGRDLLGRHPNAWFLHRARRNEAFAARFRGTGYQKQAGVHGWEKEPSGPFC